LFSDTNQKSLAQLLHITGLLMQGWQRWAVNQLAFDDVRGEAQRVNLFCHCRITNIHFDDGHNLKPRTAEYPPP
jgi:hypothetical protein